MVLGRGIAGSIGGEYTMKFRCVVMGILFLMNTAIALLTVTVACGEKPEGGFDEKVKQPVETSISIRQKTQKQEEQWRNDRETLLNRYEALERQLSELEIQKRALEETKEAARKRIAGKEKQLADIEQIQLKIVPLIEKQMDLLAAHLDADLPFLPEERQQRIERLTALRHDPDVAVSEKLRKVFEALMVEAEYGSTIEVYQQTIAIDDRDMLVDIFRLGRMSLFFQTLDQSVCGYYDQAADAWKRLPATYNKTIQTAIAIGTKRQSVELLTLPLGRIHVQ